MDKIQLKNKVVAAILLGLALFVSGCYASVAEAIAPGQLLSVLQKYPDQAVVIVLYRTTCKWCQKELAALPEVQEHFQEQKLTFIGLSLDSDISELDRYLNRQQLPFEPYWLDFSEQQELKTGFADAGITLPSNFGVPLLILLNRQHKQQSALIGYQQNERLIQAIAQIID